MKEIFPTASKAMAASSGVLYMAYGLEIRDDDFKHRYEFDAYDLWFDEDFDYILDNILEDIFEEIESDITSVWSTNESEQISQ